MNTILALRGATMAGNDERAGDSSSVAHDEFVELIATLSASPDAETQGEIKKTIWERFGTSGATFISDMANFSSTSRSLGICHFLKMIYRARKIVAPVISANNGTLLKCDADNCYAYFPDVGDAIRSSFDLNKELFRINQDHEVEEHIYLSVGIDYGDLLLIGDNEFFGDPVNTASKLGEDLAKKGETLVTDRALDRSSFDVDENVERMVARISNIEISYVRIPMTQSTKGMIA
jgi:class 3 adenylate cyclase